MKYYLPKKIFQQNFDTDLSNLYKKAPLQVNLKEDGCVRFYRGDALVLDFGKEMCGGLRVLTCTVMKDGKNVNGRIRLTFGESYREALSSIGECNATNDHAVRDTMVELTGYSDMSFCDTGYRYVRVEFLDDAEYLINKFYGSCHVKRRRLVYNYGGKDARTSEIFCVARRTVDLCSSRGFVWDGVKRDRLVWAGDIYPEMLSLVTLYGKSKELENSFDFVLNETGVGEWMNGVPAYSAWWVISVADYAALSGRREFLKRHIGDIGRIIAQIDDCVADDGEMSFAYYFVDWPTHGKPDEKAGVRAVNIMAARKALSVLKAAGEDYSRAERLLAKLLKKEMHVESTKQIIALKYFALGTVSEREKRRLIENGSSGFSTFMSYFILTAIADLFGREKAVELMKEYYGKMLDAGATTFWEDADVDWFKPGSTVEYCDDPQKDIHGLNGKFCYKGYRHSLCHGWSTGVIRFIYEQSEK